MTNKKILNFNSKLNSKERFGLRKLSIGLATVCLGTSFVLLNNQTTYAADEKTPAVQTETAASLNKEENPPAADKSATSTTQVATSTPKTSSSHTETKAEAQPAPQSSVKDANSKKDTTPAPKVAATKQDQPATPACALSSTNINDTNNVTVSTNNTSDMMANNTRGSIHVNVKNAGVYQTNDQAKISISNPDNLLNFSNNSPSLGDDFSTSTDGQGTFTFTYQGKTTSSFSDLNLDLSFTGNNDAVKT
ncbi:YSIRK-type signal peptide-containing protein, partial [Lactobacillus intestinalis]